MKSAQMETGQQFLMPKNSSIITSKLSFHIFSDGFFLNSNSEKNYFLYEDINLLDQKELVQFLKFNEIDNHSEPKIFFFDSPSMFIPSKLHDYKNSKQFLSNYTGLKPNYRVVFDITKDEEICVVYQLNNKIEKSLNECFKKIERKHYSTILYDRIKEYLKSDTDGKLKLFVNLQKNKFDLFLIENQSLIVYNSFPHSSTDDFMYYLFALIEEYKLSVNSFDVLFLAKLEVFKNYYSSVTNFHDKIKFIENKSIQNINNDHPSPYFMNLI